MLCFLRYLLLEILEFLKHIAKFCIFMGFRGTFNTFVTDTNILLLKLRNIKKCSWFPASDVQSFFLILTCIPIRGQQGGGAGSPSVPRDPPAPGMKNYGEDRGQVIIYRQARKFYNVNRHIFQARLAPIAPTGSGARGARSQRQQKRNVGAEHQPHQRRQ